MLNCDNCYEIFVPQCQDTFTLIAGLDPNTLYKWIITDYHGNEIEGEAVSDYEGQLEIEHGIPQRFTCGNYAELEIFLPGYVDEAVNLFFCEENWKCVIIHFNCEEGTVIIQEQDCDQPPPVLPCNLCNNISEATAQEIVDCFSEEKKDLVKEIICDDIPVCEDGHVCNTSGDVCVDVGSGGTETFPDTPVKKSDGVLIANAPSGKDYNVADSAIRLEDSAAVLISNTNVKATDPATISAPDGTVANSSADVSVSVKSNGTNTFPDTPVKKSDGVLIANAPSGKDYNVADSPISINSTPEFSVKATDGLDIGVIDQNSNPLSYVKVGNDLTIYKPLEGIARPAQLKLYLNTLGLVINTSNAAGIVGAGGGISQVNDLSGNAEHFVQPVGANQPILGVGDNGLPSADYNGTKWLDNTNKPYWRFRHDGSQCTHIIIAQIGVVANPGVAYGIVGNYGLSSSVAIGCNFFFTDSGARNNGATYILASNAPTIANRGTICDDVIIPNETNIITSTFYDYRAAPMISGNELAQRNHPVVAGSAIPAVGTDATFDIQIGTLGNNVFPLVGKVQMVLIWLGTLNQKELAQTINAIQRQLDGF